VPLKILHLPHRDPDFRFRAGAFGFDRAGAFGFDRVGAFGFDRAGVFGFDRAGVFGFDGVSPVPLLELSRGLF
jgi:hypothetical protein